MRSNSDLSIRITSESFACSSSKSFKTYLGISVFTMFLYSFFNFGYICSLYLFDVVNSSRIDVLKLPFLKKSYRLFIKVVLPVRGVPVNSIVYGLILNNLLSFASSHFLASNFLTSIYSCSLFLNIVL